MRSHRLALTSLLMLTLPLASCSDDKDKEDTGTVGEADTDTDTDTDADADADTGDTGEPPPSCTASMTTSEPEDGTADWYWKTPLVIDFDAGRVQGECAQVTTGVDRVVALEFFVPLEGKELVLSQQLGRVTLKDLPESANRVGVAVAAEVITRDCLKRLSPPDRDLRVCDEDGDSLTNLDEYCSQDRDPLRVERIGEP